MALTGVSDPTKKKQEELENPTEAVLAEQQARDDYIANNDPTGSKYGLVAEELLDQYLNREDFEYDVNGDALYAQYKDQYTKNANKAMKETVAQSAAYTGGYANSWGETAGQQVYQDYMTELDNKIPELRQQAYNEYLAEGEALLDKYGIAEGHYNDLLNRFYTERDYLDNKAKDEYSKWLNERDYWDAVADAENADYWAGTEFDYKKARDEIEDRRYEDELAYQKYLDELNYQLTLRDIEAQEAAAYALTSYDYEKVRDVFLEGGRPELEEYIENNYSDYPQASISLLVEYALAAYKRAEPGKKTEDGKMTYVVNGEPRTVDEGVNPYTGTKHWAIDGYDVGYSYGYMPNANELGLKPQNAKTSQGQKIYYSDGNGAYANMYPEGYYIWDGISNEYIDEEKAKKYYNVILSDYVENK